MSSSSISKRLALKRKANQNEKYEFALSVSLLGRGSTSRIFSDDTCGWQLIVTLKGPYVALYLQAAMTNGDSTYNRSNPKRRVACRGVLEDSKRKEISVFYWAKNDFDVLKGRSDPVLFEKSNISEKCTDNVFIIRVQVTTSLPYQGLGHAACTPEKLLFVSKALFDGKKFSDFVIEVQSVEIPVHKCVLAVKSPVFEAMLSNDNLESRCGRVKIEDMELATVRGMVEFFYLGSVSNLNEDLAKDLLKTADKYNIANFLSYCSTYLEDHLSISNVMDILVAADVSNATQLKESCFNFIHKNKQVAELNTKLKKAFEEHKDLGMQLFWKFW